jgi:trk system potassium uptake protein
MPEAPDVERPSGMRDRAVRFTLILLGIMVIGSLLLATPLTTASGNRTRLVDAFFTSVSAVAVTGLVTVDTGTHWNFFGQLIILVLMQIGGLGFMVGAGLIFQLGRGGRTTLQQALLVRDGSPAITLREASTLIKQISAFTFGVEAIGFIVLALWFSRQMDVLDAIWHGLFLAVSAFCNAGFDLEGGFRSLSAYRSSIVVNVTVMALVVAGSISFLVARDVYLFLLRLTGQRGQSQMSLDAKLVLAGNAVLIPIGFVAMLFFEWNEMMRGHSTSQRVLTAGFHAVASRTAGFSTVDWSEATPFNEFLWLPLMMIGGASGSTAGGVKIATVGIVFVAVLSTIRGDQEVEVFHRRIGTPLLMRAMAVMAAFLLLHFLGALALASSEALIGGSERRFISVLFEAMSALGTVGLSTGISQELTTVGKLILCLMMFVGRVGPLTLGYALRLRAQPHRYRYPETEVRIG